jgi:Protein of unknown function (DUF2924)
VIPRATVLLRCCAHLQAQRSHLSSPQRNGNSIRCAVSFPVSSAKSSVSILFPNRPTRVGPIVSRTAKLRLQPRPDAMRRKRRNDRASNKTSLEGEIAHLRDLDLRGLRARWQSAFQKPAPAHLTRHLLFAVIAYRIQVDRVGDLDNETKQLLDRTAAKETEPAMSARWPASTRSAPNSHPARYSSGNGIDGCSA